MNLTRPSALNPKPTARIALLALVCLVGACRSGPSIPATPILTGDDGRKRYLLECGQESEGACIARANEVCPQGYDIASTDRRTSWRFNRWGGGSSTSGSMTIHCK